MRKMKSVYRDGILIGWNSKRTGFIPRNESDIALDKARQERDCYLNSSPLNELLSALPREKGK